ncbi:TonB-dependent receptor domain-containing protein [Pedobacter gandavensis]|uniref:TonB-dependent receptor domain-containing protein n=1 Tax=Pedobacter gandavensis TaxID=2679963 RepID=UPI00292D6AD9|nr:TonB-dependent receptor [Pedobacter gandavensis]
MISHNYKAAYTNGMKLKPVLILLFLCVNVFLAKAQEQFLLTGVILDERSETFPFTSVALLQSNGDSKPLKGALSDEKGIFKLSVAPGSYILLISMVGYKSQSRNISVTGNMDLKSIVMEPDAKILAEVTVTSRKPMISRKIDRYVLNVSESILSSGRGTFELLNYAPGVVTTGNAISINGNTATKIMVNGRLLRLSGEQVQNYLTNLRSEDVESIEVIPNPGAEFEAEGGGGLINVILKKQRTGGLDGNIGLGATTPKMPSYNTSAQLNYGYKNLQLYGSYNFTKKKTTAELHDIRSQADLDYQTNINTTSSSNAHNFRTGAAYNLSKDQYIGLEFNGNFNKASLNSLSDALLNDPANNRYNRINGNFLTQTNNKTYTLSLNYDWKLDTLGSSFNLIADYTYNDRNSLGNFASHYSDQQFVPLFDSIYRNAAPVSIKNYNAAANYVKVFKNAGQLKLGLKYTATHTSNNVTYEYLADNGFINDAARSNMFKYTEKIAALYAQYNFSFGKTNIQLGLRGEHTDTKGFSVTSSQLNNRNYFNLFPSLFLKRQLNSNNTISFNYGRRLDRPTFNSLNPFEWRIDDYTYISGNPYLKPQFTNSFNLSYLYLSKYNLTLFASLTEGVFAQYLKDNGENGIVANYSWENLSSQKYYGINLYVPVTVAKWWSMVNNLMLYRNIIKFDSGESKRTIFSGKTTQNITLYQNLRMEVSALYQSKYNNSNQVFVPNYYIDLGLSNSFFKKKLTARVLITDIFDTNRSDYEIVSGNFKLLEKQKYLTRRFSLQLLYNFSLGKKPTVKKVEGGNANEKNRM